MRGYALTALPALLAALSGCGGMIRMNVVVTLDKELVQNPATVPTVQVNLVGINKTELPQWTAYSVAKYWSPGDKLRSGADKYEMRFGQAKEATQRLEKTDPMFDKWLEKTASHLLVLVDLPGVPEPKPGEPDPRRLVLPLDPKAWKLKKDSILITIRSGQLLCTPAPRKDL